MGTLQLHSLCKLAVVSVVFVIALTSEARAQPRLDIPNQYFIPVDFGWRRSIPLHLIGDKAVIDDLGLSADMLQKLQELQKQIQKEIEAETLKKRQGDPDASPEHTTRNSHAAELNKLLTPEQQVRMHQIDLQKHGPTGSLSDSAVAKEIGLTDGQRSQILQIHQGIVSTEFRLEKSYGRRGANGEADSQIREDLRRLKEQGPEKIMNVLSDEQRAAFEQLKGTPLKSTKKPLKSTDKAAILAPKPAQPTPESRKLALRILPGHKGNVWGVTFSPDGTLLASSSADGTVRLWEAQTGRLKYVLTGHTKFVRWVAFSPDGSTLASGSFDGTVRLWDPATGDLQGILNDTADVYLLAFSKDGKTLFTGSSDKSPRMWNVAERTMIRQLDGHSSTTWAVAIAPEAGLIATGGHDPEIRIWNAADGSFVRDFDGHPTVVNSLAFSPDGCVLAAPGRDQPAVKLWNPASGELLREIPQRHVGPTYDLAFAPDGKSLATACDDRCIRLWDVASGNLIATYAGGGLCVTFSPDGKLLASGGVDNLVSIWDVPAALKDDP